MGERSFSNSYLFLSTLIQLLLWIFFWASLMASRIQGNQFYVQLLLNTISLWPFSVLSKIFEVYTTILCIHLFKVLQLCNLRKGNFWKRPWETYKIVFSWRETKKLCCLKLSRHMPFQSRIMHWLGALISFYMGFVSLPEMCSICLVLVVVEEKMTLTCSGNSFCGICNFLSFFIPFFKLASSILGYFSSAFFSLILPFFFLLSFFHIFVLFLLMALEQNMQAGIFI